MNVQIKPITVIPLPLVIIPAVHLNAFAPVSISMIMVMVPPCSRLTSCSGIPSNYTGVVCGGEGLCVDDGQNVGIGECVCFDLLGGPHCEYQLTCNSIISSSPLVCSGNGDCVEQDTCECVDGTDGIWCQNDYRECGGGNITKITYALTKVIVCIPALILNLFVNVWIIFMVTTVNSVQLVITWIILLRMSVMAMENA